MMITNICPNNHIYSMMITNIYPNTIIDFACEYEC